MEGVKLEIWNKKWEIFYRRIVWKVRKVELGKEGDIF